MSYFIVKPRDKYSRSRHWFTDESGLFSLQSHYENYPKDPLNPTNRWNDFIYGETYSIDVDFGGMISLDEPRVTIRDGKSYFRMLVSHLECFTECLTDVKVNPRFPGSVCTIGMRWWNLCFSTETISRLIPKAEKRLKNCEEMIEGAARDFEEKLKKINTPTVKVISLRRKRK